jgi:two-component system response regulator NreC
LTKKILIVDDHDLIRDGLCAILKTEEDLLVVGQTGSGRQALEMAKTLKPDLMLLDLSMPDIDGMDVLRRLREMHSDLKVLILTVHEDETMLREALRLGASGYIIKRAASTELVAAIRYTFNGHIYVHPTMTRSILTADLSQQPPQEEELLLTTREAEVLQLVVRGYTNREIAHLLTIAIRTVEKHRANITQKLGIHTRSDLLKYAREQGLL